MGNKLYVGNLPYSFSDSDMQQAFGQFGSVSSAKVMMDRDTGRSKGFGFVCFCNREDKEKALAAKELVPKPAMKLQKLYKRHL